MSQDGWSTLLEVYDRIEAEILKDALEAQGFRVTLFQESAGALYPLTFGPLGRIEICVPDESLAEAEAWLEAYNKGEFHNDTAELGDPGQE